MFKITKTCPIKDLKAIDFKVGALTAHYHIGKEERVYCDGDKLIFGYEAFNEETWIDNMYNEYMRSNNTRAVSSGNDRVIAVIITEIDDIKVGIAKCAPMDKPSLRKGVAIAYARAKGYPIPKEL